MNSIQDVQAFIQNTINSLSEVCIYSTISKQAVVPDSELKMLECEKQCLLFRYEKGEVLSRAFNDADRTIKYPSFELWDEEYYEYLNHRIKDLRHDKLIARYNQVMFNGDAKYKREDHAKAAADAYLRIIEGGVYEVWPPGEQSEWTYINVFSNLLGLSVRIKNYRATDIKKLIHTLLAKKLADDTAFQHLMIQTLLDFPKMFKPSDLDGMEEIIEGIVSQYWKDHNYFAAPMIIETGLKLARKRKTNVKKWYEMLGRNGEYYAEHKADDKTGIIPLTQIKAAMTAYQNAGNKDKVKELSARLTGLKENLRLSSVKVQLFKGKEKEMEEKLNQQVKVMLDAGAERCFEYLKHQIVLPDEELLFHIYSHVGNVFMPNDPIGLFNISEFDLNKNIKAPAQTDEEERQAKLSTAYRWHNDVVLFPLLDLLFFKGIEAGILTADSLMEVLSESWIGVQLSDTDSSGDIHEYNWLELLRPPIQIFFHEMEKAFGDKDYQASLIPSIDSLVLKLEGMLRDLAWAIDANTIKINKKNAMQEKTLEELLHLSKLKACIDPTDLLFFRYVYTGFGLNLRNNIGHGFFRAYHYNPYYGYLIILSILRLARYEVMLVDENSEGPD